MKSRISHKDYIALLASKLHEPYEKVYLAVSYYGRDFKKIQALLFQYCETDVIPFIAKIFGTTEDSASAAYLTCGSNLKQIAFLLSRHGYAGSCL
ncbi:MAG: hypothetical protein WC823_00315 [Parcubacteria group bacterium]|jgi:hypothetical protein